MQLATVAQGRDNNFNLIRMLAAWAVLVSHAYPIALGPGTPQPLKDATGYTLGTLAVFVFFAISGFLIAASFERARSHTDFLLARVLRLYPGLFVSLLLAAFVLGPAMTTLPVTDYLTGTDPYLFMLKNLALVLPDYTLDGVFTDNPFPSVEGSIWTLFYEVACYIGVFVLGIAGLLGNVRTMALLFGVYLAGWIALDLAGDPIHPKLAALRELSLPFAIGTALYIWRHQIRLSVGILLAACAVTLALKYSVGPGPLYDIAFVLTLSYATFWLAYVPGGVIRQYNRLGDYSYGLYIYAFPLQGLVVALLPGSDVLTNILLATPLTLFFSVLSWHLIEAPALAQRKPLAQKLRRTRPETL